MHRASPFCAGLLMVSILGGCASPSSLGGGLVTPLPTEFMPTAVALTLQAGSLPDTASALITSPSASLQVTHLSTTSPIPVLSPSTSAPPVGSSPTAAPSPTRLTVYFTPSATYTATFLPVIPPAHIQISHLGELSRVSSPIKVSARLYSKVGKIVRVELHGEDGRLLGRQLSNLPAIPWSFASLSTEMDFEIRLAAEHGRLVISVEDSYGRLIDVNSVNLILLKFGESELNPASALWQVIQIQEPQPNTLIQGGMVTVSGLARPNTENPLFIELISRNGQNLGHRLAAVEVHTPGGYGAFAVDVPYLVKEVTPALLVVYESGGTLSEIAHLASLEVLLSP